MPQQAAQYPPTWTCPAGTIIGWSDGDVLRATGIRYARADRFSLPRPEPTAITAIEATSWASRCPQMTSPELEALTGPDRRNLPEDEHCQRLSITLPVGITPDAALPVMVWIHGGSYTSGAGDLEWYDPRELVREQQLIVVAVTYRLGLFGFLGTGESRPANLGLLDQLEALRWISTNIAAFGGDPTTITLFGESAGGDAIAHLMIAEGAPGLFRRAIIQSAPLGISRGRAKMSSSMAAAASSVAADWPTADVLEQQEAVAAAAQGAGGLQALMPFGTQYGLHPLPPERDADDAWRAIAPEVDVLIGSNHAEAALFISAVPAAAKLSDLPIVGLLLRSLMVKLVTRQMYGAAVTSFARRHARAGGNAYRYTFLWGVPGSPFHGAHATELPLLLGGRSAWKDGVLLAGADWGDLEKAGRRLRELWGTFARTGSLPVTHDPGLAKIRRG